MSVFLISGASSGLGEQLCRVALSQGHTVYGVARREDVLQEMARQLGERFKPLVCDVTDSEAIKRTCADLPDVPDTVILCAGIGDMESSRAFDVALHRKIFAVNYFGVLDFVEALFPAMSERKRGTLAVISSLAGYRGLPKAAAYAASKAAISTAMESLRLTYGKTGLRFVNVHPGFIDTPMTQSNKHPMPFMWSAEKAARHILTKLERGWLNINFPLPIWMMILFARLLPAGLYKMLMGK